MFRKLYPLMWDAQAEPDVVHTAEPHERPGSAILAYVSRVLIAHVARRPDDVWHLELMDLCEETAIEVFFAPEARDKAEQVARDCILFWDDKKVVAGVNIPRLLASD